MQLSHRNDGLFLLSINNTHLILQYIHIKSDEIQNSIKHVTLNYYAIKTVYVFVKLNQTVKKRTHYD